MKEKNFNFPLALSFRTVHNWVFSGGPFFSVFHVALMETGMVLSNFSSWFASAVDLHTDFDDDGD